MKAPRHAQGSKFPEEPSRVGRKREGTDKQSGESNVPGEVTYPYGNGRWLGSILFGGMGKSLKVSPKTAFLIDSRLTPYSRAN